MNTATRLRPSQRVVQVILYLIGAIALIGGTVQFFLGEPETTARLDNVHRFLAGIYFGCGLIFAWAAYTVRQQGTLVYLLGTGVFLAGCGRLLSISIVGLPQPGAVWLGYMIPELLLPWVLFAAHRIGSRPAA